MVEVRAKRGISLVMIIMVFLLKTISSSAHTAAAAAALYNKSNNNDTGCCLIADDLESEFLMDSEVRRMLGPRVSPGAQVKGQSAANCGRGKPYRPCLPPKNAVPPPGEHCDDPYATNRLCRPQP